MAEPAEGWDPLWPARRPESREAWVVVNARSRYGQRDFNAAQEELLAQGVRIHAARRVSRPHEIEGALGQALADGARWVIVGGGDGTVLAAANLLAGRDVTIGVLLLGSGNDFARSLGMPLDLPGACRALAERRVAHAALRVVVGEEFEHGVRNPAGL